MKTVGAFEAKTHLAQLLDEVERGERVTITRHGKAVALLVPLGETHRPNVSETIRKWREYQEAHDVALGPDVTIRELVEAGRRF